jgi:hypothetical protein
MKVQLNETENESTAERDPYAYLFAKLAVLVSTFDGLEGEMKAKSDAMAAASPEERRLLSEQFDSLAEQSKAHGKELAALDRQVRRLTGRR